ncbi:hypothetical protein [Solirubrobacter soli]|uniref:hypothetical protein n=1 Tax=Solirubrobacter soli TaxID=363832 RepID=UPI0004205218|nr:hypothetical protein [Solirubrobacter soli]
MSIVDAARQANAEQRASLLTALTGGQIAPAEPEPARTGGFDGGARSTSHGVVGAVVPEQAPMTHGETLVAIVAASRGHGSGFDV